MGAIGGSMGDTLVVIRTFLNHFDADIAHTELEAAGIDSMIRSDDCGGVSPNLWLGGVGLLVRDEDADRANEVLSTEPVSSK